MNCVYFIRIIIHAKSSASQKSPVHSSVISIMEFDKSKIFTNGLLKSPFTLKLMKYLRKKSRFLPLALIFTFLFDGKIQFGKSRHLDPNLTHCPKIDYKIKVQIRHFHWNHVLTFYFNWTRARKIITSKFRVCRQLNQMTNFERATL